MKQCPRCNNLFDDIYDYCLNDGTPLTASYNRDVLMSETPTVVAPRQAVKPVRSSWVLKLMLLLMSGLLIAAVAVIGFLLFSRTKDNQDNRAANLQPSPVANRTATPTPTPSPTATATKTPTPTPKTDYPATTRLQFAKGAVTTGFSGEINPGDTRSFVLACAAGQQLAASVDSGGGCVTFRSGDETYDAITSKGDNIVTVKNKCSNKASFTIEISVL